MTELSGFWTTDAATPEGDQLGSYNQSYWSIAMRILAACNGFEGVSPGYLNELGGTASTNNVAINSGGALVDGKWFRNDASQNVNIPSAGSGKLRIDRVVLRANWAGFNVSVYRIAGTESSGTPVAPAITQTSGTTYDITLYQALVNSSGTVTITDERTWATAHCDESTLTTSAGNLQIKNDGIDGTKIADHAVNTEHIVHSAVTPDQIAAGAVGHTQLDTDCVRGENIQDDQIDSEHIAAGAVDLEHMSANSVDSDQYVDGSIDRVHLSADIIDGTKIADNVVDSEHYVHGSIDLEHMSANSVDSDQYVDGSIDHEHLGYYIVETDNIAADAVTFQEAGSKLPFLSARFGGSATAWNSPGATSQTIDKVMFACGCINSSASGDVSVTLGFENTPLVFINAHTSLNEPVYILITSVSKSGFSFSVYNSADSRLALACNWIAIGQESEPV